MKFDKTLWTLQALLAALFLFAGVMKLALPPEQMAPPIGLPGAFVRFIGVAEVLGALGLVLPWLLRIQPALTPLAASGLLIIMIGAVVVTIMSGAVAVAIVPFVVGTALAAVCYGRVRAIAI